MFDMIKEQCKLVKWTTMSEIIQFNTLSFGVYAFTKPIVEGVTFSKDLWPHEFKDVVYVGMTGKKNQDIFCDRKNGNDKPWLQGIVHKRLNEHRKHLCSDRQKKVEESYKIFHEAFGCSKELLPYVNVCVLVPKNDLPDFRIRSWLLKMESTVIDAYAENFGKIPLCNVAHQSSIGENMINPTSFNQIMKDKMEKQSLLRYIS